MEKERKEKGMKFDILNFNRGSKLKSWDERRLLNKEKFRETMGEDYYIYMSYVVSLLLKLRMEIDEFSKR